MRHRPLRWGVVLVCALAFAACGPSTSRSTPATSPGISPATSPVPLPPAGTISARIPLDGPSDSYALTVTDTAVWVHNFTAGTLLRVDPATNRVVATIAIGHGPGHVALEGGFVWVLSRSDSSVRKIDPRTNKVVATISLPGPNAYLAVSPGAVWVASVGNDWVLRIDTQTNQVVATISIASGPSWMTFGGGALWGCSFNASTVWQLDPATNTIVKTYDIGSAQKNNCATVATLDKTILVEVLKADNGSQLERIDTASNTLDARAYPLPDRLDNLGIAADAQGIWVFGVNSGLYRVDPRTNQVVGELAIMGGGGVAVGDGAVWFATSDGTLLRITPAS